MKFGLATHAMTLICSGCGISPGKFEFAEATVVIGFPGQPPDTNYGDYLRVTLMSDVAISDKLDAIYGFAGDCTSEDVRQIVTFGPFSADGSDMSFWPHGDVRSGGRSFYRVYLVKDQVAVLARHTSAICVVLEAPQIPYARRSNLVRLPKEAIELALK